MFCERWFIELAAEEPVRHRLGLGVCLIGSCPILAGVTFKVNDFPRLFGVNRVCWVVRSVVVFTLVSCPCFDFFWPL